MRKVFTAILLGLVCLAVGPVVAATGQVAHSTAVEPKPKAAQSKRKVKVKPAAEPTQYAPSGEALPAREKRLRRECKGRPNAGACLGYAS